MSTAIRIVSVWCMLAWTSLSAQTLMVECTHRDSAERVIYLEREFRHADTTMYYCAYADGGRLLKQWSAREGDTLVENFRCHELTVHLFPDHLADEWGISESTDSVWYDMLSGGVSIWDTVVPVEKEGAFRTVLERVQHDYAGLIHEGILPVDLARAVLRETWVYRTLNGQILSKRIIDRKGVVTNRQDFVHDAHGLVAWSFFNADTVAYAVDSITWDPDMVGMKVVNRWLNNPERYGYSVQFQGDSTITTSGTESVVDHWFYDRTPWHVRLREAALREGPLCQPRIERVQECLIKSSSASNGNFTVNEHMWNADGKLVGIRVWRNGRFDRRIEYRYY
ncbi:MAG: hypothetical protein JNM62_08940 [Flavobacteriales bacterium]|nr:hypothetical protein [Flavobacteriales bacterium]